MIKIPMDALKDKGEDNSEVSPEMGDEVMLGGAKGIFKGEKDGMAMVEVKEINGFPVEYAEKAEDDSEEEDDGEEAPKGEMPDAKALLILAQKADKESGYED